MNDNTPEGLPPLADLSEALARGREQQTDVELIAHLRKDQHQKLYILPCAPSVENLAWYLLRKSRELLTDIEHVDVVKVRVWETPNCWAEAT